MTQQTISKTVKETAQVAKEDLSEIAGKAGSVLRSEAEARAETGKEMVSDQGLRLAESLRAAPGADDLQSRVQNVVASSVADLSEELRQTDLSTLLEGTERFARRHPGAFVAGAAIAGFALARFLRASGEQADEGPLALTHEGTYP